MLFPKSCYSQGRRIGWWFKVSHSFWHQRQLSFRYSQLSISDTLLVCSAIISGCLYWSLSDLVPLLPSGKIPQMLPIEDMAGPIPMLFMNFPQRREPSLSRWKGTFEGSASNFHAQLNLWLSSHLPMLRRVPCENLPFFCFAPSSFASTMLIVLQGPQPHHCPQV